MSTYFFYDTTTSFPLAKFVIGNAAPMAQPDYSWLWLPVAAATLVLVLLLIERTRSVERVEWWPGANE